jgi:tRNA(Ile2) C34 agmatinyltransferase TiaS
MPSEERKPTEGQRVCPKCGGEMGAATDYEGRTVYRCAPCHIWYHPDEGEWTQIVVLGRLYPPPCGHEEKVK